MFIKSFTYQCPPLKLLLVVVNICDIYEAVEKPNYNLFINAKTKKVTFCVNKLVSLSILTVPCFL